ncbi:hypothetical protein [Amazonocrinis nigriterrae]|uniref:hypothetical protein n=1 Tax=Amazonocrinis nigriterrae TaxID=2840443 RepID=UPI001CEC84BB|nr:hypothetical protein [Amazonocrinis nigriterrae]
MNNQQKVVKSFHDASACQEMMDRLERAEEELRQLKLETLQRDIAIAAEQLKNGEYTEYHADNCYKPAKSYGR